MNPARGANEGWGRHLPRPLGRGGGQTWHMKYLGFIKVCSTHEVSDYHQSYCGAWSLRFPLKFVASMKLSNVIKVTMKHEVW